MADALADKHASLQDEAIAVYEAVQHLARGHGLEAVQRYIDTVCGRMQDAHSPEHQIAVRLNETLLVANAAHRPSPQIAQAMQAASDSPDHSAPLGPRRLIVGHHKGPGVAVYVSESLTNIRRALRAEVLMRLAVLAGLGLVAAGVVNAVLLKIVARPLRQLATTVDRIAHGELGIQAGRFDSWEMQELAHAVDAMSRSLAENDRRRQGQMAKARQIQEHLLPSGAEVPGLTLACLFRPAEDIAGDYYDFVPLPDGTWLICLADVTGHGVPAAMGAAMLKTLLQHAAEHHADPERILKSINARFKAALPSGYFASVFLARWHPASLLLEYASAGHEPGLLLSLTERPHELRATGLPVGIQPEATWETRRLPVRPGNRLLLTTDGASETTDPQDRLFGRDRLTAAFSQTRGDSLSAAVEHIGRELSLHRAGTPPTDDLTLLILEVDRPHAEARGENAGPRAAATCSQTDAAPARKRRAAVEQGGL